MTNISGCTRKIKFLTLEQLEEAKTEAINTKLKELQLCNKRISRLKMIDSSSNTKTELPHHLEELAALGQKKSSLTKELARLGHRADRRGRPRKREAEKYKANHTRMTCYFTEGNAMLLKALKSQGDIKNVSAFLNKMLNSYFASHRGGVHDE
jgi:hypothetical protein